MKIIFRTILVVVGLAIAVSLFYAGENWRGKHAWENCKRELKAKGQSLDWSDYLPSPVPDDQNFFKAPKMSEWFVWHHPSSFTNELTQRLANDKSGWFGEDSKIKTEADAKDYLAWSDTLQSDFDLIGEALKRPSARIDGDYSDPFAKPGLNFVTIRMVAQTLAQRTHCYLLLGQPEKAVHELTLIHDMSRVLQATPMTLVAAMINVAITSLYTDAIAEGLQLHAWQEPQLAALQGQLSEINLCPLVSQAFQEERAFACRVAETQRFSKIINMARIGPEKEHEKIINWFWPEGWTYQNMVHMAELYQGWQNGFDLTNNLVLPRKFDDATRAIDKFDESAGRMSPYKYLASIAIPNFSKAFQATAYRQTLANEAQIACALERYHLAHGNYPERLDSLAPQLIETIPYDIIGGEPLQYRSADGGKFLLYSVGWNETDDDGEEVLAQNKNGGTDYTKGDWIWKN